MRNHKFIPTRESIGTRRQKCMQICFEYRYTTYILYLYEQWTLVHTFVTVDCRLLYLVEKKAQIVQRNPFISIDIWVFHFISSHIAHLTFISVVYSFSVSIIIQKFNNSTTYTLYLRIQQELSNGLKCTINNHFCILGIFLSDWVECVLNTMFGSCYELHTSYTHSVLVMWIFHTILQPLCYLFHRWLFHKLNPLFIVIGSKCFAKQ